MRFFYWPYYEKRDELPGSEQLVLGYDNKHDHGGYKASDLFVKQKYDSFKEEAAKYPNLNIEQYDRKFLQANGLAN